MFVRKDVPPISDLFEWPAVALKGTNFAINKVVIVTLLAGAVTLLVWIVGRCWWWQFELELRRRSHGGASLVVSRWSMVRSGRYSTSSAGLQACRVWRTFLRAFKAT